MRIRWQKVLGASALFGLGMLAACTVEVVEAPPAGVGGTGGAGGSAGKAGAGGVTGDAASPDGAAPDAPAGDGPSADAPGTDASGDATTSDTAVDGPAADVSTPPDASPDVVETGTTDGTPADVATTDGRIADATSDGQTGCFAEDQADSGSMNNCAMLPYYGTVCRDDAGLDWPPAGAALCDTLVTDLKATAFLELFACLDALPGADGGMAACSSAHDQGSADCSRNLFNRSMCPVPDSVAEGGLYGCAQIAASCGPDSGDGGIPVALCQAWLGPFNATARQGIIDCYLGPNPGATSCRDKFENYCVF